MVIYPAIMDRTIAIFYSTPIVHWIKIPCIGNIVALAPLVVIVVPYGLECYPKSWPSVYKYLIMVFASFCAAFVSFITAQELTDMHKKLDEHDARLSQHDDRHDRAEDRLSQHDDQLDEHRASLDEHRASLDEHRASLSNHEAAIEDTKMELENTNTILESKTDKNDVRVLIDSEINKPLYDFPDLSCLPPDGNDEPMNDSDFARIAEMSAPYVDF
jgi:hypothetical protein